MSDLSNNQPLMIVIAILLPPLAVFLKKGAGSDLIINIVLCVFFWVPGILHSLWVTLR
ncbi:MAG: YqaE/Pmp3 family membrane protein [Alphaproteobacteria bacterium]|nr:MAG: YqaE/Pmp3 family membrane protein [Alphaproteobacteria bacterium]